MSSEARALALIAECANLGAALWAEGDQVRLRAPKGSLSPELLDRIRRDKAGLLALLPRQDPALAAIPVRRMERAPLSRAQRRLWFLDRLEEHSAFFNLPIALVLEGSLEAGILEEALREVLTRQTALRTVIRTGAGEDAEPLQEIRPLDDSWLVRLDLEGEADPGASFRRAAELHARHPFDLTREFPCRILLCRLDPERHGLLLVIHHIASDHHSMGLILAQLQEAYNRRLRPGTPAIPPPEPLRTTDFACWERERPAAGEAEAVKACASVLAGVPPLLTLPWDHPRPAVQATRGHSLAFHVPAPLAEGVAALGRERGATPFMAWLALWGLLLARLSGQQDVAVGCPVSRRPPETEDTVGLFLSTAVMRLGTMGNPSVREYLDRTRGTVLRVLAHQEAPFDRLVDLLVPERRLDHTPLFQVMFVLHQSLRPTLALEGLRAKPLNLDMGISEFDLNLSLEPAPDGALEGFLEFSSDLFEEATVRRWVSHLLILAEQAVRHPGTSILDLPLLGPADEAKLAGPWAGADVPPPAPGPPIPISLLEACRTWPRKAAVADAEGILDYGELAAWSARIAAGLHALEVVPGDRVGILLPRSRAWIASLWGVWRAGAAFISLDPALPRKRLEEMAGQAGLKVLVTSRQDLPWSTLDPARPPAGDLAEWSPKPTDPAYVVFTSGSTGRPKGILVSHGALAFHAGAAAQVFGLSAGEAVLQFASPGFDVALEEIWPTLLRGGRVEICPEEAKESLSAFTSHLKDRKIRVANLPAPFWEAWTWHLAEGREGIPDSLRLLVTGSEAVSARALAQWQRLKGGPCAFLSGYGPSETTVTATWYDPSRDGEPKGSGPLPLGRPMPGVRTYVLDGQGRPVAPGTTGELHLAGPGLALGYLDGEATAEAFLENPFVPGTRMYRTGDLARMVPPQGTGPALFLFEGRADLQIKRRGYRIEPGEIEAALAARPEVARALAVALPDGRLGALVEPARGAGIQPDALRGALAEILPAYMLPDLIRPVLELPLLASGKPDRPAAISLLAGDVDRPPEEEAPLPGPESVLARIWAKVLRLPRVGRNDAFFHLGGDSILALRVVSLAAREGLRLAPRDLFLARTLAELACLARAEGPSAEAPEAVEGSLPPTPILAWFLDQPADFRNRLSMSLPVKNTLDAGALRERVASLFRRHEILRLRTGPDNHLRIAPFDPQEALAAVQVVPDEALRETAASPFDLARGPLFRALLSPSGRLILQAHHLVVDAVSWGTLLEDLGNEEIPGSTPFATWARLLRRQPMAPPTAVRHWERLALGVALLALPSPEGTSTAATADVTLDQDLTARLLASREPGTPRPEELFLAALGLALSRILDRSEWLLDVEGHGRELPPRADRIDLSRSVGWFTTVTPARFALEPGRPAQAAVQAAREALHGARAHAMEYGLLRYLHPDAGVRIRMAALPAANVLFNYLGVLDGTLPALDPEGEAFLPPEPLSHPLEVNAMVVRGQAAVRLGLDPLRWPKGFVRDLVQLLPECLAEVISCAGEALLPALADFPLAEASGLKRETLRALLRQTGEVEDLYPLSPLQGGMLFHTLRDGRSGEYFDQFTCRIQAPGFSPERFASAWNRAIARHSALRSAFLWDGPPEPLQAVLPSAAIPVEVQDWRSRPAQEQARLFLRLQDLDRERPFDLARPPLMRLTLCRTDEACWTMLWSNHHLILDGWSLPLLLEEVCRHYENLGAGLRVEAAPGPAYRDFIAWLGRQDRAAALAFWKEEFAGFDSPTPLPLAHEIQAPRPGWPQEVLELEGSELEELEASLRERGLTLSCLAQGAWALLLSRYGGGRDVVFGATVSGRPGDLPGADRLIGSCINTLPVRVKIPGDLAAHDWLADLRDRQALREAHGTLGLPELARLASVPPGTALFDSLVLVQNYPLGGLASTIGGTLRLTDFKVQERTNFGLTLVVAPTGASMLLSLVYDPARCGRDRAARLLAHVRNLMVRLARETDALLDRVEMLAEEEIRLASRTWNATEHPFPWRGRWHELFESHAARHPEAPALVQGERTMSYGELERRSNQLAHALRSLGVGPEVFAAVWLDRSPEMIVAVLGILKAGGAYVPLDPDYPADRVAYMIQDSRPRVLVTHSRLRDRIPSAWTGPILCLDGDAESLSRWPETHPPEVAGPGNTAFVIYTSGSTGLPKGTLVLHEGLVNLAQVQTGHFQVGPRSRILQFFSLSFDAASWEILMALGSGAALILGSRRELTPGPPLFGFLERHRITHMTITPSALAVMPIPKAGELPDLEVVVAAGEPCEHRLAAKWALGRRFYNGYGPTETTICCSASRCLEFSGPLPLGHPLPNVRMYVLDDRLGICPVGVPGEICIAGAGVARGYLNRPELTAEKFRPDPFPRDKGARLYRSGDVGSCGPDGSITFLGRLDQQVKIRGYRVEPGEIEAVLLQHPSVRQACVVVDAGVQGSPRLLAYVSGREARKEALQAHLQDRLPAYMIPAHITILEAFPVTANNKIDRKALPRPAEDGLANPGRILPSTPLEERIASVWRELLGVPEVGVTESFFDLGGHSLLVVQACSAMNQALEANLAVMDLFDLPTVRQLAQHLGDLAPGKPSGEEDPAGRTRLEGRDQLAALRAKRRGRT